MKFMQISATDRIFSCANTVSYQQILADHKTFKKFCRALGAISKEVGEENQDPHWKNLLRAIRQLRFRHMAAPIPFNHPGSIALAEQFSDTKRVSEQIVPRFFAKLSELEGYLKELVHADDNPLLDECSYLLDEPDIAGRTAVVVSRGSLVGYVEEILARLRSGSPAIKVLTGAQLKDADCYGRLLIFGHPNWFRDMQHVFTAPRATEIYLVGYNWMRASTDFGSGFITSHAPGKLSANFTGSPQVTPLETEEFNPDEILPTINLQSMISQANLKVEDRGDEFDPDFLIASNALELEEDHFIFLEAGDRHHTAIILDETQHPKIDHLMVNELVPGMFLVLRTSGGGGDYIEFIADRLLGGDAQVCRVAQQSWKERLRKFVDDCGIAKVVQDLTIQGCPIASPQNVKVWMSPRSIKTQESSNFKILMQILGMGADWRDIWDKMEAIDRAHRSAGHYIRKSLLEQIQKLDAQELNAKGRMEFVLPDHDGGTLVAIRIRLIHSDYLDVPHSQVSRLRTLE